MVQVRATVTNNNPVTLGVPRKVNAKRLGCARLYADLKVLVHLYGHSVIIECPQLPRATVRFYEFRVACRICLAEDLPRLSVTFATFIDRVVILAAKLSQQFEGAFRILETARLFRGPES